MLQYDIDLPDPSGGLLRVATTTIGFSIVPKKWGSLVFPVLVIGHPNQSSGWRMGDREGTGL